MTAERLDVLLYGDVVGWLDRDTTAADPTFRYTAEYVSSGGVALSARLPLRASAFPAKQVAPYSHGLLPENSETRAR